MKGLLMETRAIDLDQLEQSCTDAITEMLTRLKVRDCKSLGAMAGKAAGMALRTALTDPPASPSPVIVECPVCGHMVDESTLITGVWEGEANCKCPDVPAATDLFCADEYLKRRCKCGHAWSEHYDDSTEGCSHAECDCQAFTLPTERPG